MSSSRGPQPRRARSGPRSASALSSLLPRSSLAHRSMSLCPPDAVRDIRWASSWGIPGFGWGALRVSSRVLFSSPAAMRPVCAHVCHRKAAGTCPRVVSHGFGNELRLNTPCMGPIATCLHPWHSRQVGSLSGEVEARLRGLSSSWKTGMITRGTPPTHTRVSPCMVNLGELRTEHRNSRCLEGTVKCCGKEQICYRVALKKLPQPWGERGTFCTFGEFCDDAVTHFGLCFGCWSLCLHTAHASVPLTASSFSVVGGRPQKLPRSLCSPNVFCWILNHSSSFLLHFSISQCLSILSPPPLPSLSSREACGRQELLLLPFEFEPSEKTGLLWRKETWK